MKVKTRKMNAFQGDDWIGIDIILDNGCTITPFGVYLKRNKYGRWYESDSGGYYDTIKEAKEYALKSVLKTIGENNDYYNIRKRCCCAST